MAGTSPAMTPAGVPHDTSGNGGFARFGLESFAGACGVAAIEPTHFLGNLSPLPGKMKPRLPSLGIAACLGLLDAIARTPRAKLSDPHR